MRMISAALVLTILMASSQTAIPQAGIHYDDVEHTVGNLLSHPDGYYGTDVKALGRLGDASAVALTKVIGGKGIRPDQVNQILMIVTLSFQAPNSIENAPDRQPRTVLFLLNYLEYSTTDPALRAKIAEIRAEIESRAK